MHTVANTMEHDTEKWLTLVTSPEKVRGAHLQAEADRRRKYNIDAVCVKFSPDVLSPRNIPRSSPTPSSNPSVSRKHRRHDDPTPTTSDIVPKAATKGAFALRGKKKSRRIERGGGGGTASESQVEKFSDADLSEEGIELLLEDYEDLGKSGKFSVINKVVKNKLAVRSNCFRAV